MTDRRPIATEKASPAAGPYSQAVAAAGLVFVSGQLPTDPASGSVPDGIEAQTNQSIANVLAVLEAAGASAASVVKTTVFLKDMNDFATMNGIYAETFGNSLPARSTIEVARLPRDVLVEIECIAVAGTV
ncbi:MAG: Rid family detoxifying hydrolase [Aurantimonas endophytica]|jgi:2-iminobutanoate/2-iminopropanoate deaminase|uniref:2-iminobutanoate/2-iminopropanoate deaminase n=1 Tax=Aurantimonas endophytica TaxID=1522175 RepID=A0A7W6MQX0_9HYPH|nr:Rid family detoxifying hydrolase [Aurantimonas endophytica]MBB4004430.1 2-iminobutanoate/2-iminopropanoate deaminase [Aurantimonas endophytica]MCO6405268.1 deaminase [Aurantimonas endophytica]